MIVFTVHEPAEASGLPAEPALERADKLVFIKDGFAWLAAFPYTAVFWLLSHRLWGISVCYLASMAAIAGIVYAFPLSKSLGWLSMAAVHLLLGLEGNNLRRRALARRGYRMLGTTTGRTTEECERRFFDDWLATARSEQPGQPDDVAASEPAGSVTARPQSYVAIDNWERLKAALSDLKR